MYESPIEVIYQDTQYNLEEGILKACQNVNINVDREELIKALQYDRDQYQKGYYDGLNKGKWISCSERLPKEDGRYLCTYSDVGTCVDFGLYADGQWFVTPLAWMPLPEPYKQNDHE